MIPVRKDCMSYVCSSSPRECLGPRALENEEIKQDLGRSSHWRSQGIQLQRREGYRLTGLEYFDRFPLCYYVNGVSVSPGPTAI